MQYNFDEIIDRRSSNCLKWDTYESDVLPLWVADMDFKSPQPVIDALRRIVDKGFFGYPGGLHAGQVTELHLAIVDWLARRHNWRIQPEWLVLVPGVVVGFNLTAGLAGTDGAVLIQTPVYPPILNMAANLGIHGQSMELTRAPDGAYSVDWDRFEAAFTPTTRLFLLCNPHNPVGRVFQPDELARIAKICLSHGVTIVSDEIHADLVYSETRHFPIATLSDEIAGNTITLMAPSKSFNLAGVQCSFAVIPSEDLRKWYIRQAGKVTPWVNMIGTAAAQAAYRYGQEWLDQLLPYLQANRDYLLEYVSQNLPGVTMSCPQGTYLAWLDCRAAGIPDDAGGAYQFFLKHAHVAVQDGAAFGPGGQGFVRLNFGAPRSLLQEGLERMKKALEAVGGKW